jgi:hypothetical protein
VLPTRRLDVGVGNVARTQFAPAGDFASSHDGAGTLSDAALAFKCC